MSDLYDKFLLKRFGYLERAPDKLESFILTYLDEPYTKYDKGRVSVNNREGRRYIELTSRNVGTKRHSTTYARYLYQVYFWKMFGKILPVDIEIDHINNNILDDRFLNLQPLTSDQNIYKNGIVRGRKFIRLLCPICLKIFEREYGQGRFIPSQPAYNITFCSHGCSVKLKSLKLSDDEEIHLGRTQILYIYKKHWFDYEDYFGDYYPYTEIVEFGSRELLSDMGIPINISGITERCWRYVTSITEQQKVIEDLLQNGFTHKAIAEQYGLYEYYVCDFIKQYLPHWTTKARKVIRRTDT